MQIETAINNGFGDLLDDPANDIYFPDIKLYDSTRYTDWQDFYLGGTARFSNIQAGISGGTGKCTVSLLIPPSVKKMLFTSKINTARKAYLI